MVGPSSVSPAFWARARRVRGSRVGVSNSGPPPRRQASSSSVLSCEMWGSVSCSCGPGKPPPQEAEVRKRHIVVLSEQERARLHTMIGRGVAPASALTHARILLKANQGEAGPGWTDVAIGAALEVNRTPAPRGLLGRCGLDHERA